MIKPLLLLSAITLLLVKPADAIGIRIEALRDFTFTNTEEQAVFQTSFLLSDNEGVNPLVRFRLHEPLVDLSVKAFAIGIGPLP
jgi:hypothetical protein